MDDLDKFKAEVEAFLARTHIAASRFGDDACNDSAFVLDLRAGREPRFSTIRKVRNYMQHYDSSAIAKIEAEDAAERSLVRMSAPEAAP